MQPIFIADRENVDPVTGESSVHHHKPQASTSGSVQPLQPKQQGTQPVQPSNSRQPLADVTHFFVQQETLLDIASVSQQVPSEQQQGAAQAAGTEDKIRLAAAGLSLQPKLQAYNRATLRKLR